MFTVKLLPCEVRQALAEVRLGKPPPTLWSPRGYEYWLRAFLPEWVQRIGYSSLTKWVTILGGLGGLPSSHLGKSNLKKFMFRHHSMKLLPGGIFCVLSDWANPKNGPPVDYCSTVTTYRPLRGAYSFAWIIVSGLNKIKEQYNKRTAGSNFIQKWGHKWETLRTLRKLMRCRTARISFLRTRIP